VRDAIAQANARAPDRFRVVHFTVQPDHLDLLIEASDKASLSGGVRGLSISIARRVNAVIGRRGSLWADRWRARSLRSPAAVRAALIDVLANFRKSKPSTPTLVDGYSSAPYFAGFLELDGQMPIEAERSPGAGTGVRWIVPSHLASAEPPVAPARTWLLRKGWLRGGPLSVHAVPV
jgi:hypothetical protein